MSKQPAPQGGGGDQGSNSNDLMFVVIFFVALICVLWITRSYYFPIIFKLKGLELLFANYFVQVDPRLYGEILMAQMDPNSLTQEKFFLLLNLVGNYYKYPIALILFVLAIFIFLKSPGNKFSKIFTMASFRDQEKSNWPQIIPASKIELVNADIKKGEWASSATPMEFAKNNQLLEIIVNDNPNPILKELAKVAKLKESRARQVFAAQLGHLWQGADKLPVHTKALFAIFAAIANQEAKAPHDLLKQYNISLEYQKIPDFTGYEPLLDKYKDSKVIKRIEKQHAYVLTIMASLLEIARTNGVLACADFLWLKTVDRQLWYMLQNVGRRGAFPEVAGAVAHWRIEARMQKRLISPMIDEAAKALKTAIAETIYHDENDD